MGLGSAANERSRGTMAFLQALPAPMWPIALAKLIFGLLTLIAVGCADVAAVLWLGPLVRSKWVVECVRRRQSVSGNIYLDVVILCVTLAASFYIWSAAAGVNRKDEVSAGAVALAVMARLVCDARRFAVICSSDGAPVDNDLDRIH